jgi:hypothetical protein
MAMMIASGIGSIVANELGKLALDNAPLIKQVAKTAIVDIAKKSFDYTLDTNPNFASFLGHFGISSFNSGYTRSSVMKKGRHRKITYNNH